MDQNITIAKRIIEDNITSSIDGEARDNHMAAELDNTLRNSKYSDSLKRVSGKVLGGHVLLEGMVSTLADELQAIELAKTVRGIKKISSNLDILSSHQYDNATIKNKINQLLSATQLNSADISAHVDSGRVTLRGYVNNLDDMETAIELAAEVEGVDHVSNKLEIR